MNKEELLKLLRKYEEAYYSGESVIPDETYDALKDTYIKEYGEYESVPSEGITGFKRVKHIHPLLSLKKVQLSDKDLLKKELERLWPVVIQPKFDGLSIEIQPDMKFITRGDGHEGDDVTEQCMQIPDIDIIRNAFDEEVGPLRAEIIMTHNEFKRLNEERAAQGLELFSNPRNAASGMLRNKDLSKIQGLTVMIYEELGSTCNESDDLYNLEQVIGEEDLEYAEDTIGITPTFKPVDVDAAIEVLQELEGYRKLINYDIDGWVVKSNIDNSLEHHGGMTGHHPKNAFAVKGEAKGAWTKINGITWQVGKEAITPVALLEPVAIDGSIVSRCTLHNVSILKALGLDHIVATKGETLVKVVKANDVIPKIIEVKHVMREKDPISKPVQVPIICPVCNAPTAIRDTESDSEILICTSEDCEAKLDARILHMVKRDALDITGMSEATISKITDTYQIQEPHDILHLDKEHILKLEGFADKSAENLANAIKTAITNPTIDKVLYASSIPLIGRTASKDICKTYSIEELGQILAKEDDEAIKDICKVKGIGIESAKSLISYKNRFGNMFACMENVQDIKVVKEDKDEDFVQLSICVTGPKEPYKSMIEEAGHKFASSVSKKTAVLVVSDGDYSTSKAVKAKALGTPIITTVEELETYL